MSMVHVVRKTLGFVTFASILHATEATIELHPDLPVVQTCLSMKLQMDNMDNAEEIAFDFLQNTLRIMKSDF